MKLQFANDIIQLADISHNLHMPDVLGQSLCITKSVTWGFTQQHSITEHGY